MKKSINILLIICLLLSSIQIPAFANETSDNQIYLEEISDNTTNSNNNVVESEELIETKDSEYNDDIISENEPINNTVSNEIIIEETSSNNNDTIEETSANNDTIQSIPDVDEEIKEKNIEEILGGNTYYLTMQYSAWLDDWDWEFVITRNTHTGSQIIAESYILLKKYNGDKTNLTVPGYGYFYQKNRGIGDMGQYDWFDMPFQKYTVFSENKPFTNIDESGLTIPNTTLKTINFEKGFSILYILSFDGCTSLESINFNEINTSQMYDMTGMFQNCENLKTINGFNEFDTSNLCRTEYAFYECKSITEIDLSNFNTSNVDYMSGMFWGCENLKTIKGIDKFDTSTLMRTDYMFARCKNLTSIDLSSFNTSNVEKFNSMFSDCKSLKTISLPNFTSPKVINVQFMFDNCCNLEYIDLSNCDFSNIKIHTDENKEHWEEDHSDRNFRYFLANTYSLKTIKTPYNINDDVDIGIGKIMFDSVTGEKTSILPKGTTCSKTLTYIKDGSTEIPPDDPDPSDDPSDNPSDDDDDEKEETTPSENKSTLICGQKINAKSLFSDNINNIARYKITTESGDAKSYASISKHVLTVKKAGDITIIPQYKDGNQYYDIENKYANIHIISKPKLKFAKPLSYTGQNINIYDYFANNWTDNNIKAIKFTSSKPNIATIDDTGNITAGEKNGITNITAYFSIKNQNNAKNTLKVTAKLTIKHPAFKSETISLKTGQKVALAMKNVNATMSPTWTSSSENAFTVEPHYNKNKLTGKALIKAYNCGDYTLTATIDNKDYICKIHIAEPAIKKSELKIRVGKTKTVGLKNTKYKANQIKWYSEDENIATVDEKGKVKGISAGEVKIYTETGGVRNECLVTVY